MTAIDYRTGEILAWSTCKGVLKACARRRTLTALLALAAAALGLGYWVHRAQHHACLAQAQTAAAALDFDGARQFLTRYLAAEPNSFPARLAMAKVARRAGYVDEAQIQLDVCDALQGKTVETELERRLSAVQQGELDYDSVLWDLVAQGYPEAPLILEALARGYRKNYILGRMQEALTRLLELQPEHTDALMLRAWVLERRHLYLLALEDLERALQIRPDHEETRLQKAQLLELIEKPADALTEFVALQARRPQDPRVWVGLLKTYVKTGKVDDARRCCDVLADKFPRDFSSQLERARFHLERGQALEAEQLLREVVEHVPFDYAGNYSLHQALQRQGKFKEAEKVRAALKRLESDITQMNELTEKLQKAPFDADLRSAIAALFMRSGEEQEGVRWLKTVLRLDPQHKAAHEALAEYYERRRQPALAQHHRQWASRKAGQAP